MIHGCHNLSYSGHLQAFNLQTLTCRRLSGDMIQVYEYSNGMYDVYLACHGHLDIFDFPTI